MKSHTTPKRLLKQFSYKHPVEQSDWLWQYTKGNKPNGRKSPTSATRIDGFYADPNDLAIELELETRLTAWMMRVLDTAHTDLPRDCLLRNRIPTTAESGVMYRAKLVVTKSHRLPPCHRELRSCADRSGSEEEVALRAGWVSGVQESTRTSGR